MKSEIDLIELRQEQAAQAQAYYEQAENEESLRTQIRGAAASGDGAEANRLTQELVALRMANHPAAQPQANPQANPNAEAMAKIRAQMQASMSGQPAAQEATQHKNEAVHRDPNERPKRGRLVTKDGIDITDKLPFKTVDFRGDPVVVVDFEAPHKSSSSGRIYTDDGSSYFPSVADLEIVDHDFSEQRREQAAQAQAKWLEGKHDCNKEHPGMSHDDWWKLQLKSGTIKSGKKKQPADQTPRHDCNKVHPDMKHEEWKKKKKNK